jgi:multimeric flavodoxin WrbA
MPGEGSDVRLRAVFLNCTLKRSPEVSNTEALAQRVVAWFDTMNVESEIVRVVDYNIPTGVSSDEGDGDEWPGILAKITAADIIVIAAPIWFGHRSSVAQLVIERLDGTYNERNEAGQYPLYNKVGGVVVTGNEDGAHSTAESTLFNLSHLGCTIPPNSDTYWVGDAGPGPSYIEAGGENHAYTQRTTRWMAHNLVHLARMLKEHPIPAEGNTFDEETDHRPHIG